MRLACYCCLILLSIFSCQKTNPPQQDKLSEKAEPYDMFGFQRSWPDRDFDWKGWRKVIGNAMRADRVQERGVSGCSDNTANWTLQGPANIAGRANTLAVKPGDDNTVLAGFSAGGIFKTTDGGANWRPVFDDNLQLSIGDITFDPANPDIVYAGTGDPNMPSFVFNGDGVYKSTDGGETWHYVGLSQQGIVSKVLIDPLNPQTLYVATMGNPYVRDNERGVYKSTDGGLHWQQVLFVSNQAGASDLAMNPANAQVLYASFWDRIRNNSESVIYGPHARVYKTTDGGANWTQVGGGLPTGVMGRTGLAISQQNPDKVYALYVDSLSTPGGLYKTTDGGQNWTPVNIAALEDAYGDFGWYFGKIRLNPDNDEDLYFLGVVMWRKQAGSNTWQTAAGGHADSHDLVFAPSGRRYWANDGGVYRNDPGQSTWTKCNNLPTTQFYHTNFNPHFPNFYFGGAQDNGVKKGNAAAINNWTSIFGADGFRCAFHPDDPDIFWVETQNGVIHKTSDGGNTWQFGSTCLGTGDRCNWDTPYFLSSHSSEKLFAATYRVYFAADGVSWAPISGDLTDGIILEPRFHTISCVSESPALSDKLFAGTSDGNVWRREPNGTWANITAGLPNRYVTSVYGSPTLPNRIFTTHSGFRDNEYIPHIHRSDNNGQSWADISGDLPSVPVNDLFVLPGHADSVLFAATDAGVYFTRSSGAQWMRLGANMPYIPVFDLEHNPTRKELVAATYARGIWTFPLDSVFVQQGAVTVSVAGNIRTNAGAGVAKVFVGGQTTGSGGAFFIPGLPGCQSHTLAPYRNDFPLNGVSTFDLVLISKHILALTPFDSPYKIVAADANKSKSVTSLDIVTIRKLILGIDTAFTANTSWRFIPDDFDFSNPNNPFQTPFPETLTVQLQTVPVSNLDFTAVKVGDVNGSATPAFGVTAEERIAGEWSVQVQDLDFEENREISVEFSSDLSDIAGVQFSIQFDRDKLAFQRIEPLRAGLAPEYFGTNRAADGMLSVCFENQTALKPRQISKNLPGLSTEALFRVIFKAKMLGNLRESLHLGELPTPALAFRPDGTALKPVLDSRPSAAATHTIQVRPNPFGQSGVWLKLAAESKACVTVQLFDNQGKILFQQQISGLDSERSLHVPATVFPAAGTYFYKAGDQVGKMVFAPY